MSGMTLWMPVLVPLAGGLLALAGRRSPGRLPECLAILATLANLVLAALLFGSSLSWSAPWFGTGFRFALRLDHFGGFILLAAAGFAALVTIYSWHPMAKRPFRSLFYSLLLISVAMVDGAVLADHLVVLLFFWEGLLLTLFGMIAIGSKNAYRTATKAFVIVGITDLCMMVGIALTGRIAGTLTMSDIHLPLGSPAAGAAMILLMIGATSKAGSMPFHSWIPDAALDAPLPFMAFMPASLEKLLGIYFLSRITLGMFELTPGSAISKLLMILGAGTILLAVMMALVQRNYKKLLSFHAISQVGYMILGIGTALPAGIVGGIFHMINHAIYKCGLFLTAGSVERQAGTTDLAGLGGLRRNMPVTFACFLVTAASISGVPPFNGFFSKELIYDAALERSLFFYLAAILGSFLTAASFLKLGHSAFFGRVKPGGEGIHEAPAAMLVPMVVIALTCIVFGVFNALPLHRLIQPVLGPERLEGVDFAGWPGSPMLVVITLVVLGGAILNHLWGARRSGSGLGAADHIHHAPVLRSVYPRAEAGAFDPFGAGMRFAGLVAAVARAIDRAVDWIYGVLAVSVAGFLSRAIRSAHRGSYPAYVLWSLAGAILVALFLVNP